MKKLTALLLTATLLISHSAFANNIMPEQTLSEQISSEQTALTEQVSSQDADGPDFSAVGLHLVIDRISAVKKQTLVFDLRDCETNVLLDTKTIEMNNLTSAYQDLSFTVPTYKIGKTFILHMSFGEAELTFDGNTGAYFVLQTYSTPSADGLTLDYFTDFYMSLRPAGERVVNFSLNGERRTDLALYPYPDGILISAVALRSLGIENSPLPNGGVRLYKGDVALEVYPDQLCAYKSGSPFNMALAPKILDRGELFVPVADTASVFGCPVNYSDDGYTLNLSIGYATVGFTPDEETINSRGIASDTNYLIWVSKSEFTVRVYEGSKGSWHRIASFPCAIGAPSSPTIEGTFKYYQYQTRWEYASYYVGPIMRFKGGYALHSTLLRYNGSDYDARVGVRISHGCVRLHPSDIKWLAETAPLYTTVYVTA